MREGKGIKLSEEERTRKVKNEGEKKEKSGGERKDGEKRGRKV